MVILVTKIVNSSRICQLDKGEDISSEKRTWKMTCIKIWDSFSELEGLNCLPNLHASKSQLVPFVVALNALVCLANCCWLLEEWIASILSSYLDRGRNIGVWLPVAEDDLRGLFIR